MKVHEIKLIILQIFTAHVIVQLCALKEVLLLSSFDRGT